MVQWSGVNFAVPGCFIIWMIIGQGPIACAGGGCLDIFTLLYLFYFFSPLSPFL